MLQHFLETHGRTHAGDRRLMDRASTLRAGGAGIREPFVAGVLFLSSSLRTRVGFEVAALRLGGATVHHTDLRWDPKMSDAESFADTVRIMAGLVDVLVIRANVDLADELAGLDVACPVICAGDLTSHPVQALADLFAIEEMSGPVHDQRIAVVGDLTMRAARSFLHLLERFPPAELLLVAAPGRELPDTVADHLRKRVRFGGMDEIVASDVISMAGLPPHREDSFIDADQRARYVLTEQLLGQCRPNTVVLSPMPVIDEISPMAALDARVRLFEQNALSVFVRMAILESVLVPTPQD